MLTNGVSSSIGDGNTDRCIFVLVRGWRGGEVGGFRLSGHLIRLLLCLVF